MIFRGVAMDEDEIQEAKTPNEVWKSDLLGRREEADLLVGYIESLFDRPGSNLKDHGYTIAVDAGYGEGKTFFLKRLAKHLSFNHPVAYIDAWADDLADEPLVALLATLKKALGPIDENSSLKDKWGTVLETTGHVSKVVMIGLAKRALGSLITHQAADFLVSGLGGLDQAVKEQVREQIGAAGQELADEATKRLELSGEMDDQIAAFESSKKAMRGVKDSLKALVKSLGESGPKRAPIVIVIDELDRCRPTYAIKLLEEIKHLFDVPGIVFILGLYGDQLAHSISGAYGPEFNGAAYLKKFINRRYELDRLTKNNIVKSIIVNQNILECNFDYPLIYVDFNNNELDNNFEFMINYYIDLFKLTPREIHEFFDYLITASISINPEQIILPYFIPLLICYMKNLDYKNPFQGLASSQYPQTNFGQVKTSIYQQKDQRSDARYLYDRFDELSKLPLNVDAMQRLGENEKYLRIAFNKTVINENYRSKIWSYRNLIKSVSRFRN